MVPKYLKNHIEIIKEKKDSLIGILKSSTGNSHLQIYYYGELSVIKNNFYVVDSDYPVLIVAKDPLTNEEFVVFDGTKHGYDPMFCNDPYEDIERKLERYKLCNGKIQITLGYSIDYEDEKKYFEFNDNEEVILKYGTMNWEEAKSIGYDWISLKFVDYKKDFFEYELA